MAKDTNWALKSKEVAEALVQGTFHNAASTPFTMVMNESAHVITSYSVEEFTSKLTKIRDLVNTGGDSLHNGSFLAWREVRSDEGGGRSEAT